MLSPEDLEEALRAALRPRGPAERIRARLGRGLSAIQVLDRLPSAVLAALSEGQPDRTLAHRQALDAVSAALRGGASRGVFVRARVQLSVEMRVKGARLVEVDVFRLP